MWQFRGHERPPFAAKPEPGQESVWDYPRPPALVSDARHVLVRHGKLILADSTQTIRVLETASPPTFYVPPGDVMRDLLVQSSHGSFCEWKGRACYWSLRADDAVVKDIGWSYPAPSPTFAAIAGFFSFYPGRVECHVDGERVQPQPGGFYGGWVTSDIAGPFKGEPGTGHW
jgi:uncharacterized protein (DUF427 family)